MNKCDNCYWRGSEQCDRVDGVCYSYYPINEEMSDEEVMLLVEDKRREYNEAWNSYLESFLF